MRVAALLLLTGCVSFELQVVDASGARARAAVIVESWVNQGTQDFRCGLVDEHHRLVVRHLAWWPWSHLAVRAVAADESVTTLIDHRASAPPDVVHVQLGLRAAARVDDDEALRRCPGLLARLKRE